LLYNYFSAFQIVSKSVQKELNRGKIIFRIYLAVYDAPQGHHSAVYHTPLSKHYAEYSAKNQNHHILYTTEFILPYTVLLSSVANTEELILCGESFTAKSLLGGVRVTAK